MDVLCLGFLAAFATLIEYKKPTLCREINQWSHLLTELAGFLYDRKQSFCCNRWPAFVPFVVQTMLSVD